MFRIAFGRLARSKAWFGQAQGTEKQKKHKIFFADGAIK
jgi:hypothetical protein